MHGQCVVCGKQMDCHEHSGFESSGIAALCILINVMYERPTRSPIHCTAMYRRCLVRENVWTNWNTWVEKSEN